MRKTLAYWGFVCASLGALSGCELIAAVDHDLIEGGGGSTGTATAGGGEGPIGGSGGGEGGGGGGPDCETPEECPAPPECQIATCEDNTCGTDNEAELSVCDLEEAVEGVCTDAGVCVECVNDDQCTTGGESCDLDSNVCVPMHCTNDEMDQDETDVDCGGEDCAPCINGDACVDGDDCESGFCDALVCAACANSATDCPAAEFCDAGVCTVDLDDGMACDGAEECANGNCNPNEAGTDICCAMDCSGECETCANDGLSCADVPDDDPCGTAATCTGDNFKPQDSCQAGACVAGTDADCANDYNCNAAASPDACFTTCAAQGECGDGAYCILPTATGTMNTCAPKKTLGMACNENFECTVTCAANLCT